MKTTHTPGPWHINTLETVPASIHACRGHVATVSRGSLNEIGADEIEANTRLIAAAPDLLAALEALESGVRLWISRGVSDADLASARAAIAKAKGGA